VADLLTHSNGLFGFLTILTWNGELGPFRAIPNEHVAAAYIGLGLVADGVDGIVARAWGSTGLGEALDAINDALTFSVAPAVFLIGSYAATGDLGFRAPRLDTGLRTGQLMVTSLSGAGGAASGKTKWPWRGAFARLNAAVWDGCDHCISASFAVPSGSGSKIGSACALTNGW
jgi:hypothetical protein